jgi:mannose-6-phosphate isomerase-like protein (cupin superfamily)
MDPITMHSTAPRTLYCRVTRAAASTRRAERATMKTTSLGAIALLVSLAQIPAGTQVRTPTTATDVTNAEILAILKMAQTDQQLKVVDIGKYNVGVGVLHRGPTHATGTTVNGLSHNQITEVYYVISGSGTLVTGGTMATPKSEPADGTTVKVLVGPSMSGAFQNGQSRKIGPGDVVIIPPGVPHGFSDIDDHIDYLSIRMDPDHVLPSGYVNAAIK